MPVVALQLYRSCFLLFPRERSKSLPNNKLDAIVIHHVVDVPVIGAVSFAIEWFPIDIQK